MTKTPKISVLLCTTLFQCFLEVQILCEYKQKYIILLPLIRIEVKLCTCVIEWCIKDIWQLTPSCQTLVVSASKQTSQLSFTYYKMFWCSTQWRLVSSRKDKTRTCLYMCVYTNNLLTLFLTTPLWLRVKMRCTLYVLVNMEPNAREKPAERRYTLAW